MLYLGVGDCGVGSTGGPARKLAGLKLGLGDLPSDLPQRCCGSLVGTGMLPLQLSPYHVLEVMIWALVLPSHAVVNLQLVLGKTEPHSLCPEPQPGTLFPSHCQDPVSHSLIAPSVAPPSCSGPAHIQHTSPTPMTQPE